MRGQYPSIISATFLLFCGLLLFSATPGFCAQPLIMQTEDERLVKWDLTADTVTTFNDSEIMEARGNVHLKRGNEYLKADFARYYMSTKWVYLQGNVQVRTGRDELRADEAEFDLRSRVGWLTKGRIFMDGPHAYISGDRINKYWGDVYSFSKAKVTTCDGDVPAWSISADEGVLEIDGYARLSGSSFQVMDTTVAYTPFFIFPTKTSRQTGLLMPEYGRSSSKGVYYNQPFFWAINESSDLTVNEYFMEKRGFMHGIEYRTRPSSESAGWIRADWMYDKKRKLDDSGDYGGDGYLRTNHDRYWLRGMLDMRLPDPVWRLKADVDYVSDQYFLSEFRDGFSGFRRSREELFDFFRRDLQEKDRKRVSGIVLSRDWDRFSIALSSMYRQDQYLGNGNRSRSLDDTAQQLPQVDAYLHKGRIFANLPLEIDAAGQAAYMYRRYGTRGARYEITPRITLPINTRYGSVIASAGVFQTFYDTERASRMSDGRDSHYARQTGESRTLPEFNIATFTEVAKVFTLNPDPLKLNKENVGDDRWLGLRHSVQPRVEYRFLANEYQEDNPHYVSEDRINPKSEIVYSLTNVLTTKKETVVLTKDENGEMVPTVQTSYHDVARLRLEQAYDIREADRNKDRDRYERRPFGDIFADLTISPTENIDLSTRNNWSPYMNEFTRHQSGVAFKLPEYGSIYAGYDLRKALDEYSRRRDHDVKYLRLDLATAQLGPWSLGLSFKHDFKDLSNEETDIDLIYNHQCFKIIGRVSVDPQEENYQLMVQLTGLGD